jgi:hypothetical protein
MAVTKDDCITLAPYYRRQSFFCLTGGLGIIVIGGALIGVGHLFTADKLLDVGAAAISSTALVPFKSFLTSNQLADLFARARASFERGAPISPLIDGILTKAIERAAI